MNCPRCGNEMMEVTKHTVAVDACASCGGIWLDKGELGKIAAQLKEAEASLDRELTGVREPRDPGERVPDGEDYRRHDHQYYEHRHHDKDRAYGDYKGYKYRKKSGFQRLFDIFD